MVLSMEEKHPPKLEKHLPRYCPNCGPEAGYMDILSFLGTKSDGYFCPKCKGYFVDDIEGDLRNLMVIVLK